MRRIAWPLLVWSLVLLVVGWPSANAASVWFWLGDAAHLWYLGVLLVCYLIGWFTRWIPPLVLLAVLFIGMLFVKSDIALVNNTLWFGLFFFAGAALSRVLDWWLARHWILPALMLLASALWAGYSATVYGYVPLAHWRPLAFGLLGIIAVVWFAARAPRVAWLEWVGHRSIVFYVAHVPLIWLTVLALRGWAPHAVTYIGSLLVALGGSWLLARYCAGTLLFELPPTLGRRRSQAGGDVPAA